MYVCMYSSGVRLDTENVSIVVLSNLPSSLNQKEREKLNVWDDDDDDRSMKRREQEKEKQKQKWMAL